MSEVFTFYFFYYCDSYLWQTFIFLGSSVSVTFSVTFYKWGFKAPLIPRVAVNMCLVNPFANLSVIQQWQTHTESESYLHTDSVVALFRTFFIFYSFVFSLSIILIEIFCCACDPIPVSNSIPAKL